MSVDWKAFVNQISHYESFVLTSHIRPDCDALGSELAMAEILRSVGKKVRIINAHRTPPALEFLDPAGKIEVLGETVQAEDIKADCILILDTSAWAQLGDMADVIRQSRADKMVLDHHVGEDALGATMYKDYVAEATGHLVVQCADALGVSSHARLQFLCSLRSPLIPVGFALEASPGHLSSDRASAGSRSRARRNLQRSV